MILPRKSAIAKSLVCVLFSLLTLLYLFVFDGADCAVIARAYKTAPRAVLAIAAAQFLATLLCGMRYWLVLHSCGERGVGMLAAVRVTFVSYGVAAFLPASTGASEAVRLAMMRGARHPGGAKNRDSRNFPRLLAMSLADRGIGFSGMFLYAAICGLLLFAGIGEGAAPNASSRALCGAAGAAYLVCAAAGIAAIGCALRQKGGVAQKYASAEPGLARFSARDDASRKTGLPCCKFAGLAQKLRELWDSFRTVRMKNLALLALPLAISAAAFAGFASVVGFGINAAGGNVTICEMGIAYPLIGLVGLLPVTLGGFGGGQFAAIGALAMLGFGIESVVIGSGGVLSAAVALVAQAVFAMAAFLIFPRRGRMGD